MSTDVNKTLGLSPRLREILGGLGVTELGYLDGVTAGTTTASKAVVAGTGKNVDILTMSSAIAAVHAYVAGLTATGTVLSTGASASVRTLYAAAIGCSGAVSGTFTGPISGNSVTAGSVSASGTLTHTGASASLNTVYASAIGCSGAVSGTFTGNLTGNTSGNTATLGGLTASATVTQTGASANLNTIYCAAIGSSGAVSGTTFTGNSVTVGNVTASGTVLHTGASASVTTLYAGAIGSSGAVSGTVFTGTSANFANGFAATGNAYVGDKFIAASPTASAKVAYAVAAGSGNVVITPGVTILAVTATRAAAPTYGSGGSWSCAVTNVNGVSATISFYDMAGGAASANSSAYCVAFGT